MIARHANESQRAFVERVLKTQGQVATYDVLYALTYDDGRPCSITRLAAIIHELRSDGWDITPDTSGGLATYRLAAEPRPAWKCLECGTVAFLTIHPVLGGMGQGRCDNCHATRYFRAAA